MASTYSTDLSIELVATGVIAPHRPAFSPVATSSIDKSVE